MKSALTTVLITLLTLETVQTSSGIYKKVGDTVVLSPGSVSGSIKSITWKHNSNLAVEWYGDSTDFYPKYKGRCKLNTTTGELTISGLTLKDSGSYTAEINNRVLDPTNINVISEVPTPTVSESCDAEKTHCVLTCEGITTDAEPVNYTWWSGDVIKSQTKELNITKEEKSSFFRCMMINPVSTKRSKQVVNPVLNSNTDNPDFYKKVGDTVVLSPGSIAAVTSIVWKHGSTVGVKWDRGESVSCGDFKGRCTLKTTTGELTISKLTPKDSGSYTVEINGDAIKTTKIKVISAVPTPTISAICDIEKADCVFTCEVNTAGAEPVTYTWWSGDVMMKSETKELRITKEEKETSFFCKVENPVSSESSKEIPNPFFSNNESHNNSQTWIVVVVVLLLMFLILAVIVCVVCKQKRKKENNTVTYAKNGAVNQEDRPGDKDKVETASEPLLENKHAAGQTPAESIESKQPVNQEESPGDKDKVEMASAPLLENKHAADLSEEPLYENTHPDGQTPAESAESKQPESSDQDQKTTEDDDVTKM